MADWFKFYENGLDEPRLQFAIGTLSEVCPVWVGILTECCRHKCETIRWDDDEAYLFGFSRKLNVSIPKVNEAVNLLKRIKYIEVKNGLLTVVRWGEFQSEYMKRKHRNSPFDVRTLSEHCPNTVRQEEKEERRGEETTTKLPKLSKAQIGLIKRFESCLNGEWVNDAGKWVNRIKQNQDRSERVISEIENAVKELRIKTTPARYAEQIWKEFK